MRRAFAFGDILSISTGRLVSLRGVDAVYEILDFMTGEKLFTHQLSRASDVCAQALIRQLPWLEDPKIIEGVQHLIKNVINLTNARTVTDAPRLVFDWLEELRLSGGWDETYEIVALHPEDYKSKDPMQELLDMGVSKDRIIIVGGLPGTEPPLFN